MEYETSLPENLPQKSKKKHLDCPDGLSDSMQTAKIDESTHSSDTIVITVPDRAQMTNNTTSIIDNEFIMIDDVTENNKRKDNIIITDVWSQTENNPQQSNDIIVIDDDEDDLLDNSSSNKEKSTEIDIQQTHLSKHYIDKLTKKFNQTKRLALPLISLDKLFVCNHCSK